MRLIAIEHGSTDLIVYVEAPSGDFDDFASEVDAMLASIRFLQAEDRNGWTGPALRGLAMVGGVVVR